MSAEMSQASGYQWEAPKDRCSYRGRDTSGHFHRSTRVMEMIQVTRRLQARRFPLHFFCNPTTCHHLHPRPPQANSSPHKNTATDQVRPIGPVFQTSPATLTQHTHCHHHWFNQLGPDSPQSWFGKKARLASRSCPEPLQLVR